MAGRLQREEQAARTKPRSARGLLADSSSTRRAGAHRRDLGGARSPRAVHPAMPRRGVRPLRRRTEPRRVGGDGHAAAGPLGSADSHRRARRARRRDRRAAGRRARPRRRWQMACVAHRGGGPASRFAERGVLASIAQPQNHAAGVLDRLVIDEYDKQSAPPPTPPAARRSRRRRAAVGAQARVRRLATWRGRSSSTRSARASSRRALRGGRAGARRREARPRGVRGGGGVVVRRSRPTRRGSSRRRATPPAPPLFDKAQGDGERDQAALQLAATSGDSSNLVMVHILRAHALPVRGVPARARTAGGGRGDGGDGRHLESTYGFSSQ